MESKKRFLIIFSLGIALIFIVWVLVYKFTIAGKVFSFFKILILGLFGYLILILLARKPLIRIEERHKSVALSGLILVWFLVGILVFLIFLKSSSIAEESLYSCSMYHGEKDFDLWWENNKHKYPNITKEEFKEFPFQNGLIGIGPKVKVRSEEIRVGDIIVYDRENTKDIAHRAIEKWEENGIYFFKTLGDNNIVPEIVNGSSVTGKLIEIKPLSFFERDGCVNAKM